MKMHEDDFINLVAGSLILIAAFAIAFWVIG